MPHSTLKLLPGVDQNRTLTLNEAAISETQLVRFVPDKQGIGLVQKLGGWTRWFSSNVGSIVRALWPWEDTNSASYLALGQESTTVAVTGLVANGSTIVVTYSNSTTTPQFSTIGQVVVLSGFTPDGYNGTYSVTAFTTTTVTLASTTSLGTPTVYGQLYAGDGLSVIYNASPRLRQIITPRDLLKNVTPRCRTQSGSPYVIIDVAGSEILSSDTVYIKTPISVGGLVLFGLYPCTFVDGSALFEITATDVLGNLQLATSTVGAPGGGAVPLYTYSAGSAVIKVTLNNHGYSAGDTYTAIVTASNFGTTIYGNYTITEVLSVNEFNINASTSAAVYAVTGASWSGGIATVTFSGGGASFSVALGDTVTISGMTPSGYDVTGATVTASTANSVSYAVVSDPGPYVSGGSVNYTASVYLNGGNAQYDFFKVPGAIPAALGYGVGGYGSGGYGTGVTPVVGTGGNPIQSFDWTLDNWGQILVAGAVGGPIFVWDPLSGIIRANIITNAPPVNDGVFVAMPQQQIIAWGSTFTGIQDPLLIRWCEVGDFDVWQALPTNQAGSYRVPKGSRIVGCIQGPQQGLVWTDLALWAMQYVGPPYIYQFNEIGTGCGLVARKAATSMNGVVYWMGQSQFFKLGPNGVEMIRCPIWDVIFQDLDSSNVDNIRAAANSYFGEVTWYYPTLSGDGEPTKYAKYNVVLDQWDFGTLTRTAWINQSVLGQPIGAGPTTIGDEENFIFQHETSPDADGSAMTSNFQTGYFSISEGEYKVFVDQVWPDMKWGYYDGSQDADLSLTFLVADYPTDSPRTYGPFAISNQVQFVTPRFRGRLVSIKMESTDPGSFWRIGATRYRFQQDGKF
jgi:hypothetical protein